MKERKMHPPPISPHHLAQTHHSLGAGMSVKKAGPSWPYMCPVNFRLGTRFGKESEHQYIYSLCANISVAQGLPVWHSTLTLKLRGERLLWNGPTEKVIHVKKLHFTAISGASFRAPWSEGGSAGQLHFWRFPLKQKQNRERSTRPQF